MERPNILLLMTDQHRGDALGIEGHPVVQTPYLDSVAAAGIRFQRAYSACPVCIAARRTLMTGQRPATHGVVMNAHTQLEGPTLPGELARAGYQTHLAGKLHFWPKRALYGFMSADWSDGHHGQGDDYHRFLIEHGVLDEDMGQGHGCSYNGWVARPWHLEERFHQTHWNVDCALRFLRRRDPTMPFFLNVSIVHPHQPCTPPQCYWDRYINKDLPAPVVGEWSRVFDGPQRGQKIDSWRTALEPDAQRQFMAGYFGCIDYLDNQIGRLLRHVPPNTIIVFLADHGEMLGDHQWIRKRTPYEGSARIPMIFNFPEEMSVPQRVVDTSHAVELMDVMPTLLDAADVEIPETVEGQNLMPLLRGEREDWRPWVHGECSPVAEADSGMQYLTDGRWKYIYWPGTGTEQLFDLAEDPAEMHDLGGSSDYEGQLVTWRGRLIEQLTGRPEGFVNDDGTLAVLGGPTPAMLPHAERRDVTVSQRTLGFAGPGPIAGNR
jgi:choline-sulfatase